MKIAIIGNFDKEITPASSGGTEVFTYSLVHELAKKDTITSIDVYGVGKNYFNSEKIHFKAILPDETKVFIETHPILKTINEQRSDFVSEFRFGIANKIFKSLHTTPYDVVHDNSTSLIFNALSDLIPSPVITTLHTNVSSPSIMIPFSLDLLQRTNTNQYFVSIANHQRNFIYNNNIALNIIQTIYNGIDISKFTFSPDTSSTSYGLWLGRISKKHNKGIKEAMQVSNSIGYPLTILTSVDDKPFFEEEIKPLITNHINFIPQSVPIDEKNTFYEKASFFLYPIIWEEPFGLVFLEAMACGTPVIAFAKGAVPEIIKDGVTGFIVNPSDDDIRGDFLIKKTGVEGLCEAVKRLTTLPTEQYKAMRAACRKHVEEKFTIERMANEYEALYKKLAQG